MPGIVLSSVVSALYLQRDSSTLQHLQEGAVVGVDAAGAVVVVVVPDDVVVVVAAAVAVVYNGYGYACHQYSIGHAVLPCGIGRVVILACAGAVVGSDSDSDSDSDIAFFVHRDQSFLGSSY